MRLWTNIKTTGGLVGIEKNMGLFSIISGGCSQGRLTINNRYTQREFEFKFSALRKDDDLKYTENSKK